MKKRILNFLVPSLVLSISIVSSVIFKWNLGGFWIILVILSIPASTLVLNFFKEFVKEKKISEKININWITKYWQVILTILLSIGISIYAFKLEFIQITSIILSTTIIVLPFFLVLICMLRRKILS